MYIEIKACAHIDRAFIANCKFHKCKFLTVRYLFTIWFTAYTYVQHRVVKFKLDNLEYGNFNKKEFHAFCTFFMAILR